MRIGDEVEVYRNLRKNCWSVRKPNGKVLDYFSSITLTDCSFIVRASGQRRARATGHKNVHAFVRGKVAMMSRRLSQNKVKVVYNPFEFDTFVDALGRTVLKADTVSFREDGCAYLIGVLT